MQLEALAEYGSSAMVYHAAAMGAPGPQKCERIWPDGVESYDLSAVPHADAVGATQDENEVTWNAALHTG